MSISALGLQGSPGQSTQVQTRSLCLLPPSLAMTYGREQGRGGAAGSEPELRIPSPPQSVLVTSYHMACWHFASIRQRRFCFPSSLMSALWLKKMKEPAQGWQANRGQSCDPDKSLCASQTW